MGTAWEHSSPARTLLGQPQHIDTIGNPHGFAIKLMGVKGAKALGERHDHETQDFLMVDYPIVRTASDYLDLFRAALNAPGKMPWSFFFPSLDPSKWSGLSQPETDRSRGASFVYALARACGASPARWNQSYPQVGLRGVIGGAAPVEWRGRERASLRDRLTLSAIGWQLFSLIARSRLSR
jgi:hypothetical protein